MIQMPYLIDRCSVADATTLIAAYGQSAAAEAATRAHRSRNIGNHIHFCRWRQIERLIVLLSIEQVIGTVH